MRHRVLSLLILALLVSPAAAWNFVGHKVVAEIAWQELDPKAHQQIVDTLRHHPRFDDDFAKKMPEDIDGADKATQDHWIFLQAASWPDIARKTDYDRPDWHYIDIPVYLGPKRPVKFNISTQYPEPQTQVTKFNCVQALKYSLVAIRDPDTSPADRAVALSWLFHLVGDMHQPLHNCALVSDYFPDGDKGGNAIKLTQGKNLHSLWDGLLGTSDKLNNIRGIVAKLRQDRELWDVEARATPETWILESHGMAESMVYDPAILQAVRAMQPGEKMEPITLPENYLKAAGNNARRRVVAAGVRLANLLSQ